jgi:hypothetical protein
MGLALSNIQQRFIIKIYDGLGYKRKNWSLEVWNGWRLSTFLLEII